ncbi:hypothetical protein M404DRAFT_29434 [Pisolithus tinctorius Marx 270]|uniref:CCHC-type domain-containing protein n=1 Tax=Pisolithus tinctorius Marx 270 TaxID=870435 RepID=A0A0C3NZ03_PISTI|nr:hypothetical protein M404DRAFT_29434 [Pisolithus tinctorius Marx 270]
MATKTCFQPPCGHSATNPDSASSSGTCHESLQTPTLCCPIAPIPNDDPGHEGLDDKDNNNPDDDDPGNSPGDDNLDENDPEDELDFPDLDAEPVVVVFNSLARPLSYWLAMPALTQSPQAGQSCMSLTPLMALTSRSFMPSSSSASLIFKTDPGLSGLTVQRSSLPSLTSRAWLLNGLSWTCLGLRTPDDWPLWMDSWREFILELQTTFSPHDPVADAESQLDHLHMKDNQCINKYMVDFNQLASQVWGYGDGALHHHFYSRLPDWIKDEEEIQWASKHQGSSSSNTKSSGSSNNNNQSKTSQDKPKTSSNNNSTSSPKAASSKPGNNSNLSKPEPSKLGKDGKLTPEECKHCIDRNLCMFCGGSGHFADKCPKKASKAKAHAMATTEAALASGSGSTPETKK